MNLKQVVDLLKPPVDAETKLTGVSLFFGKWLESLNRRVVEVEARSWEKGDKGDTGEKGKDGKDGKDGRNGIDGKNGRDGRDGKDGKQGTQGVAGVSVVDAEIAADGNFVFKLSNGKEIDAGNPIDIGKRGVQVNTQLANQQITVSTTAPGSPVVGDLWYDIS